MDTKKWYLSRTLWLATLQSLLGVAVIFSDAYPSLGWLIIFKSILDGVLRFATNTTLE